MSEQLVRFEEPMDSDTLHELFESKIREPNEDGTVAGYQILPLFQAEHPFVKVRGEITWVQDVIQHEPDAVFVPFHGGDRYTVHRPIEETAQSTPKPLGSFVARLLRRP